MEIQPTLQPQSSGPDGSLRLAPERPSPASVTDRLLVRAELKNGRLLREALHRAYQAVGVANAQAAQDFNLAVSEAFSNAICHGSSSLEDDVEVWFTVNRDGAQVHLEYRGEPFSLHEPRLPDEHSTNGRGRYLMQILADHVEYEFSMGWTHARIRKRWR